MRLLFAFPIDSVPVHLPAGTTELISLRIAGRLPTHTAHIPNRLLKTAGTTDHPRPRFSFHAAGPARWEDGR